MATISSLGAMEVLDSRGQPTVQATCVLDSGAAASASVPSGRSTGAAEAWELRDGDPKRYAGKGCLRAAENIVGPIAQAVCGRPLDQTQLDNAMIELDGTPNKQRLGANAILAVSVAFAKAAAKEADQPLYRYFAGMLNNAPTTLPRLTINLFSGGKHAGGQVAMQDVLIVPSSSRSVDESLVMMYDIYQAAAKCIHERYGMRLLTADEGGLAPPFERTEMMLSTAVEAIEAAGRQPGVDAHLAIDVASSHFYRDGIYEVDGRQLDAAAMIELLSDWVDRYPLVSVEDPLAEDAWEQWIQLTQAIGDKTLIVGDDLLCTNPQRIERAVSERACNALLLKVNQIGSLTEAAAALTQAREAGWQVTISVRSGETEDDWAADLAVGWSGDQFKNGSITQSERLAKYNRLLAIERELPLPHIAWPGSVAVG